MNIGKAAKAAGVPAKTIRYYESIGLIGSAGRRENGYRDYDTRDVEVLRFIARARSLGFPVKAVGDLLKLWSDRERASADVKRMALEHVDALERKAAALQAMSRTLRHLAACCQGDTRPDCPILEELAAPEGDGSGHVHAPSKFGPLAMR